MEFVSKWLRRTISVCLTLWLIVPAGREGIALGQQAARDEQKHKTPSQSSNANPAGSVAENNLPDNPQPAGEPVSTQDRQASTSQSEPNPQQDGPKQPVGTAAAPYEKTMGVAASRPAGAAIAPAKQKRVRTILISLGVIAGAGIAIGSVAALSHGSANRP